MPIEACHTIPERLRRRFEAAHNLFVLTGAGVSAESGVPTFRSGGKETVWKGMPFSVISSAAMVERDLPAVWEWFDYRRDLLRKLKPNSRTRRWRGGRVGLKALPSRRRTLTACTRRRVPTTYLNCTAASGGRAA